MKILIDNTLLIKYNMTNLYYKQVVSGDENKKKQLKIRLELLALVLDQIGSKTWNFFSPNMKRSGWWRAQEKHSQQSFQGFAMFVLDGNRLKKAKKKRLLENTSVSQSKTLSGDDQSNKELKTSRSEV